VAQEIFPDTYGKEFLAEIPLPDGRHLMFLSGTAFIRGYEASGSTQRVDYLNIEPPISPAFVSIATVVPMVGLGEIYNDNVANNATWGAYGFGFNGTLGDPGKIRLKGWITTRDSDGGIRSVVYHITAVGRKHCGTGMGRGIASEVPSEENKALVRRAWEGVSAGNLDVFDEVYAADCIIHEPDEDVRGIEGLKQFVSTFLEAFPDLRITVEDEIAEGDKVVTRWRVQGTHQGELRGIAPTGNRVNVSGITIHRIEGDKIVEEWESPDYLGMLQQIGAIPYSSEQGGS
jgi:steroid delta-isomerase-like uncharacterized protein